MALTRRGLLGVGLGGAALLAVGGIGVALRPTVLREPAMPLQALSPRAFSVLAAVADRVCPGGDGAPTAAAVHVAEKVDALMATLPSAVAAELEQALMLLENALAGLVLDGRPRTFTASTPAQQDVILATWRDSSLQLRRQVYRAVRGLTAAAYHGSPETYASVGYPGPPDFSAFLAARRYEARQEAQAVVAGTVEALEQAASAEEATP
ncbi:MAG: gluconate 2-dehydrogenase subunit 3 family protein [Alphaproteobacteria bacterium]|nr:gluconate 2-dehydrogenase subunit 3 family protein [Alphaproteobacteria bacterium]